MPPQQRQRTRAPARLAGTGLALLGALAAAVSAGADPRRPAEATGPPLSPAEMRGSIVDHTMHRTGRTFGIEWEWAGYYLPGGRMIGRAWWGFGDIDGYGTWRIKGQRWCQFWENVDWSEGAANCYRIYPAGDKLFWDHRDGPHTEDWLFSTRPGNAFGLSPVARDGQRQGERGARPRR